MEINRITQHPILDPPDSAPVPFSWNHIPLTGRTHDTIASALIANDIHIFGHHHKDGVAQGLFCANGQCSQCTVLVNGIPQKACMTPLQEEMEVTSLESLPTLPIISDEIDLAGDACPPRNIQVLIIGGGPAGLSAAISLGQMGIHCLLVDDKQQLGGKLVLQTHRFFGSAQEVHAGKRGIDIAKIFSGQVESHATIEVWSAAKAVGVFSDHCVGIVDKEGYYHRIQPEVLLIATGARENSLIIPGNTLPGVYGAGAFQTLINRDLVRPAKKLFIVGGGNVGLITAYHALQAGVEVIGLIEATPKCGGYQVHEHKLSRLGVPILTSHTILSANGLDHVESITIAECDSAFKPIMSTQKTFACDAILIAVGLSPVNEFAKKAEVFGMVTFSAGDAEEIAEASAAMISGKIQANKIAQLLGSAPLDDICQLERLASTLRARPGNTIPKDENRLVQKIQPIIHCNQEIPCNPCSISCPIHNISIPPENILTPPVYQEDQRHCINCERCITICPGLAITIVDARAQEEMAIVSIPFEFDESLLQGRVILTDMEGWPIQEAEVISVKSSPKFDHTKIVKVKVPVKIAHRVSGIQLFTPTPAIPQSEIENEISNEAIICRCERVTAGEIRTLIRSGIKDINQIKSITRAGMGACGSKTCHNLIKNLLLQEGVPQAEIVLNTDRPLFYEVELGVLALNQNPVRKPGNE